ncbi:MAG: spore coat associated protein CotJA [Firmicutes bacterium]|jgi:hypothetical protein|nr:spore coat associated protein CotJA [Bacillota bacterium]
MSDDKIKDPQVQQIIPQQLRLARAYIPIQMFTTRLEPTEGLRRGTIFPELYMPYQHQPWKKPRGNES